jgi:hypothetical protein
MKRRKGPLVPDEFLTTDEQPDRYVEQVDERAYEEPPSNASGRSTLPYWIVGGLGVAAATTGFILGQQAVQDSKSPNANTAELRDRAIAGDIIAWSGVSVGAGTLLWYLLAPSSD